jgi:hypothetical protein
VRLSGHGLVLGRNGTGKTTWVSRLIEPCAGVVIIDSKRSGDYPAIPHSEDPRSVLREDRVVWEAPPGAPREEIDQVLALCYRRGNVVVVIDEALHLCTASYIPRWYRACLVSGRGRGVTVVSIAQRARGLHNDVVAEAWWYCLFALAGTDAAKLEEWDVEAAWSERATRLGRYECILWDREARRGVVAGSPAEPVRGGQGGGQGRAKDQRAGGRSDLEVEAPLPASGRDAPGGGRHDGGRPLPAPPPRDRAAVRGRGRGGRPGRKA